MSFRTWAVIAAVAALGWWWWRSRKPAPARNAVGAPVGAGTQTVLATAMSKPAADPCIGGPCYQSSKIPPPVGYGTASPPVISPPGKSTPPPPPAPKVTGGSWGWGNAWSR